jgi:hypothetical protein
MDATLYEEKTFENAVTRQVGRCHDKRIAAAPATVESRGIFFRDNKLIQKPSRP